MSIKNSNNVHNILIVNSIYLRHIFTFLQSILWSLQGPYSEEFTLKLKILYLYLRVKNINLSY